MKNFTIFLLLLSLSVFPQKSYNNALKMRIADRNLADEFTVLVKGNIQQLKSNTASYHYKLNYHAGDIASVSLGLDALGALIEHKIVTYAEFIEPGMQVLNDTMLVRNRIKGVKTGAAPLPQGYDGTGIVIGIIDSGTDWRHNDFKDAAGNTRIQYIWEQNKPNNASTPMPYNYGIEWTAAQINASLCTHDDVAQNGHGTHSSGIAAGNGLATGTHEGCAPKADLVVVAVSFSQPGPTIADAVQYIFSKATLLGKPCVINASVGNYYGSHDGTDLEAKLIENMLQNTGGRVMVAAAGNGGNIKFHTKTQTLLNDSAFTWITNNSSNLFYTCYADTAQIKNVKFSVGANRANFFDLGKIGFKNYDYGLAMLQTDTLKYNGNRIGVVKTSASINAYGVYELLITIKADTLNLKWRIESKGVGLHHAWNFDFVSNNLPSVGQYPQIIKYVKPDTLYSLVSSFQCLDDVITVANYANLDAYYDYNNNLQNNMNPGGSRIHNSSIGPTRDERQKPDITASGHGVFAAAAVNLQANWISSIPQFMAPGGQHVYGTGTSASAPVVAGFAALFLQAHPYATSNQVKNAINNCAYSDGFTGATLPNAYWGHGKLDGKAAMMCYVATGIKNNVMTESLVEYFPNPFANDVQIKFKTDLEGEIFVYSAEGKLLIKDRIKGNSYDLNTTLSLPANYSGMLLVRITSTSGNTSFKLIRSAN